MLKKAWGTGVFLLPEKGNRFIRRKGKSGFFSAKVPWRNKGFPQGGGLYAIKKSTSRK